SAKGEFRDQVGHVIDVMATCVDVGRANYPAKAGQTPVTPMEGKSLVPAFAGRPLDRDYLAWEHEGNRAIRSGKWKLVAKAKGAGALYAQSAARGDLTVCAGRGQAGVKPLPPRGEGGAGGCGVWPSPPGRKN